MNNQIAIINPKWEDYILRAELMSCRPVITTITKHCSTGKTEQLIDYEVYNITAMSKDELWNKRIRIHLGERFMLSDINKKRTSDYVLESLKIFLIRKDWKMQKPIAMFPGFFCEAKYEDQPPFVPINITLPAW